MPYLPVAAVGHHNICAAILIDGHHCHCALHACPERNSSLSVEPSDVWFWAEDSHCYVAGHKVQWISNPQTHGCSVNWNSAEDVRSNDASSWSTEQYGCGRGTYLRRSHSSTNVKQQRRIQSEGPLIFELWRLSSFGAYQSFKRQSPCSNSSTTFPSGSSK